MLTLALGVLLVSTSTATAIVALLVLGAIDRRKPPQLAAVPAATDPAVFLFDAAGRPAYDGLFFPRG